MAAKTPDETAPVTAFVIVSVEIRSTPTLGCTESAELVSPFTNPAIDAVNVRSLVVTNFDALFAVTVNTAFSTVLTALLASVTE